MGSSPCKEDCGGQQPVEEVRAGDTLAASAPSAADPLLELISLPRTIEELYGPIDTWRLTSRRPTAGPRIEQSLDRGKAPIQLYSYDSPNGRKAGILLEELGVPYDAHPIDLAGGEQFTSGFVNISPNAKIPAIVDQDGPGGEPISIMESGAIFCYLCDKFPEKDLLPKDPRLRAECLQWVFWQVGGQGPTAIDFAHFFVLAPRPKVDVRKYGISHYGMEVQRHADVLERHLAGYGDFRGHGELRKAGPREFLVGDRYTVADIACMPWAETMFRDPVPREGNPRLDEFLGSARYQHVKRWVDRLQRRIQVRKGMRVCSHKKGKPWLEEGDEMFGL